MWANLQTNLNDLETSTNLFLLCPVLYPFINPLMSSQIQLILPALLRNTKHRPISSLGAYIFFTEFPCFSSSNGFLVGFGNMLHSL